MDCIQLLCLETGENRVPLKWHRHTEKCRREYSLELLVWILFLACFLTLLA